MPVAFTVLSMLLLCSHLDSWHVWRYWLWLLWHNCLKSHLAVQLINKMVLQCIRSFLHLKQCFWCLYSLFLLIGSCGLLKFVVITGQCALVLYHIAKWDILECTTAERSLNFWWAISDKFGRF